MLRTSYTKWSEQESQLIYYEIDRYLMEDKKKKISWVVVSQIVGSKTPRYCYDWYYIRKNRDDGGMHRWRPEELEMVKTLMEQGFGPRQICERMPDLCVSQMRNKMRYLRETMQKNSCSSIDIDYLQYLLDYMV